MDERERKNEFLSILGESHPGLTFEEYRDSCVYLLFYHYLCLRFRDKVEEGYRLKAMVRLAVRGKLQMASFLHFMEAASPFFYLAGARYRLNTLSFYKKLQKIQSLEKQKSYARFFRKLIKKIDAWEECEELFSCYPDYFALLLTGFSRMRKDTYLSEELIGLYSLLPPEGEGRRRALLPDFRYGVLLRSFLTEDAGMEIYGYEDDAAYREILELLSYMKGMPEHLLHLYKKEDWMRLEAENPPGGGFDFIAVLAPEGVEPGTSLCSPEGIRRLQKDSGIAETLRQTGKGEFPFIFSGLSLLRERGRLAVVLPSALLYREGREMQIRKYLVSELNCLEMVMLLPDALFSSTGQKEVLLLFRRNREEESVMFFDCSEEEGFDAERLRAIENAWAEQETEPGFCSCVTREKIGENDDNWNLPRYIVRSGKMRQVDIELQKKRIEEIDAELREIEGKIAMFRQALDL